MHQSQPPRRYEIVVRGHLGPTLLEAFPALAAELQGANTLLHGSLADQCALFGVLCEIDELGLELLEVRGAGDHGRAESHHPCEDVSSSATGASRSPAPPPSRKEIAMQALVLNDLDNGPVLQDVPIPEPGAGQVRLRVKAAALNRLDTLISGGMLQGSAEYLFPVVLGRDAAGVVDAVGDGVEHVRVGDAVIAHVLMDGKLRHGTLAEYAVVSADAVVAKPASMDFAAAACVPLAGAAALAAVDAVDAGLGSTVLIVGATGGVGSYAIQLAVARGATVIATGLPEDADRLRGLGAAEVVDYRDDVAGQVRATHPDGIDGLIELVSFDADSVAALAATVRDGGWVASSLGAADPDKLGARGITATNIVSSPVRETLATLIAEIERGAVRVDVKETLPFDQATEGLDKLANGHARGKLVVTLD